MVDLLGNANNVPMIMKMLERQFGRPEQVLKAFVKRIEGVHEPDQKRAVKYSRKLSMVAGFYENRKGFAVEKLNVIRKYIL